MPDSDRTHRKRVSKKIITKLTSAWDDMRVSLWVIPALLTLFAGTLSLVLLAIDERYYGYIRTHLIWLFGGSAGAARSLLSTLAASVITVISIAFSLMVIAVQQASVQYTPRVLRTFTADRVNQVVLGTYLATFVYSLSVLRAIRDPLSENDNGFVPALATTTAILLALICIGMLIYFINHIVGSLQAATIIGRVHRELLRQIGKLYPEQLGESAVDREQSRIPEVRPAQQVVEITANKGGFVTLIDEDALREIELTDASWLRIHPKVGDFVMGGQVIACVGVQELPDDQEPPDDRPLLGGAISDGQATSGGRTTSEKRVTLGKTVRRQILSAVVVENQRSPAQDPMFAVRQLVDMSVKALSPGINDPTTANYCIRYLGDAMCRLSRRAFPDIVRVFKDSRTLLCVNRPTWEEFVVGSFRQIQQNAGDNVQVTEVMLRTLHQLALAVPNKRRAAPIRHIIEIIGEQIATGSLVKTDKILLREGMDRVLDALRDKT